MRLTLLILFALGALSLSAQDYTSVVKHYQDSLAGTYKNPATSPLPDEEVEAFGGLEFFPIDPEYKVTATFARSTKVETIDMGTSAGTSRKYDVYGTVTFALGGKSHTLKVYQSHRLRQMPQYKDFLFLPFNDATNGVSSYGGGRYLELSVPKGNTIELDFNFCYQPYCAYTVGYACAIPPDGQYVNVPIEAGVMMTDPH